MIIVQSTSSDLKKETRDIGYELETTIYTSKNELNIIIDSDKLPPKYRSFVVVTDKDNSKEVNILGYKETLNKDQIEEQFEKLSKDAAEIKKANTLHS
jgi:hypothetical protein|tara:strand:+ start:4305 stop:4598 length:294 start_codon:yes stop_codon:yes gene_type:complete